MAGGNRQRWKVALLAAVFVAHASLALGQIRLPAIDPTGNRIFLPAPNSSNLLLPGTSQGGLFGHHRNTPATPASAPATGGNPLQRIFGHHQAGGGTAPATPAFTHPADPAPCHSCGQPGCNGQHCGANKKHLVPKPPIAPTRGQLGEIIMTPHRIVAPVGAEVVVLAGICGGDGYFVKNQPLEWMLSNDSVGQIIEVGGMDHAAFNRAVPPSSKKFDGQYAHGRTGLKPRVISRGTPSPGDDIDVLEGQTWLSLHSASPGTTYLTAVAPEATAWDKRRATTIIHWVDGLWAIPSPVVTKSGTVQPLTTKISRTSDGSGIAGWKVRYTIVGGTPAEFVPTGSQSAEIESQSDGLATVQVRQQAGKIEPGTTQIRVDVVRPPVAGEQELVVESGLTGITWSSPALTLRAIGPRAAGISEPYNYRVEVSNPGDQVARDVVVSTEDLGQGVEFVSSDPKPSVYGNRYEWRLGDLQPGLQPLPINIQLRSPERGIKRACFRVASQSDSLETEACAETEVAAPCLGVRLDGPTTARVGDEFRFDIDVVNQCDEALENVRVSVQYDAGLNALQLGNPIEANIGTLRFGEKKSLPLTFRATRDGVQCFVMNVVADGGHTASGRRCIEVANVVTGQLGLRLTGPQLVTTGQTVETTATITNTGTIPLESVTVTNRFSPSLRPVQSSTQYRGEWLGEDLAIFVGSLNPGQSANVTVQYKAMEDDPQAITRFSVSTPSGAQAQEEMPIRIDGPGDSSRPQDPQSGNPGGIAVPSDPRGGLAVKVEPLQNEIVGDGRTASRVNLSVTNNRQTFDQNVQIMIIVPPGLRLIDLRTDEGVRPNVTVSPDNTRYLLETQREMRPASTYNFVADVVGVQPGQATIEIEATSDNTLGSVSSQAALRVLPGQ